jgi:hypothetical protein
MHRTRCRRRAGATWAVRLIAVLADSWLGKHLLANQCGPVACYAVSCLATLVDAGHLKARRDVVLLSWSASHLVTNLRIPYQGSRPEGTEVQITGDTDNALRYSTRFICRFYFEPPR